MTRVIAGRAGSLRLEVPKAGTRPTSDRVREAIFSALESWELVAGARVLDCYAGSGALGLEAASRGAEAVTLVERHAQAAQVATRNARTVAAAFEGGVAPVIIVAQRSVQSFLEGVDRGARFDIVFFDPPYDLSEPELAANLAAVAPLVTEGGVVMVERSNRSPEPEWPATLTRFREKHYGETQLWWSEPVEAYSEPPGTSSVTERDR